VFRDFFFYINLTIWYAPKKIRAGNFFDVQDIILQRKKENYLKNIDVFL
jgi:hypothetical protein